MLSFTLLLFVLPAVSLSYCHDTDAGILTARIGWRQDVLQVIRLKSSTEFVSCHADDGEQAAESDEDDASSSSSSGSSSIEDSDEEDDARSDMASGRIQQQQQPKPRLHPALSIARPVSSRMFRDEGPSRKRDASWTPGSDQASCCMRCPCMYTVCASEAPQLCVLYGPARTCVTNRNRTSYVLLLSAIKTSVLQPTHDVACIKWVCTVTGLPAWPIP